MMTVNDRVLPCLVGIDIGCGVTMARLNKFRPEYQKIDKVIRENISSTGRNRNKNYPQILDYEFDRLKATVNKKRAMENFGTLGFGNHFFEIDVDGNGNYYVSVHSGSRSLGKEVAEYYLSGGQKLLKMRGEDVPYELTYLTGELKFNYLRDLLLVQYYARLNRQMMIERIGKAMKWKNEEVVDCPHNYIYFTDDKPILRKEAIFSS